MDIEINISQKNHRLFTESLNNYMKKVALELYNNINTTSEKSFDLFFADFINESKIIKFKKKKIEPTVNIEERCIGRIWHHVDKKYDQCRRRKNNNTEFCKTHQESRNYGEIK